MRIWKPVFDNDLVTDLEGQLSKISDTTSSDYIRTSALLSAARVAADVKAGKLLPQDRVNAILAEDKRKHQEAHQKTLDELKALRAKASLSTEEREDLERRITETQSTLRTTAETAAQEREKLIKGHKKELDSLNTEKDAWKKRFTESTIKTAIISAAVNSTPKAVNPDHLFIYLQPKTRLVEELGEDGRPTGSLIPKVSFSDKDKNGKPIVLDLSPEEAVKRMSEMEEHFNLFASEGQSGFGRYRSSKGPNVNVKDLAKDPVAYREARKKGQLSF